MGKNDPSFLPSPHHIRSPSFFAHPSRHWATATSCSPRLRRRASKNIASFHCRVSPRSAPFFWRAGLWRIIPKEPGYLLPFPRRQRGQRTLGASCEQTHPLPATALVGQPTQRQPVGRRNRFSTDSTSPVRIPCSTAALSHAAAWSSRCRRNTSP